MNFRVFHRQVGDLVNIADFLSTSSLAAAERFLDEFETTCARIKQFPRLGHNQAWLTDPEALVVEMGPWMLIYQVAATDIRVRRIIRGSADLPDLPLE